METIIRFGDYMLTKEEWEKYYNFTPSLLQKIFWTFWPTKTSWKYAMCQRFTEKDFEV